MGKDGAASVPESVTAYDALEGSQKFNSTDQPNRQVDHDDDGDQ